VYGEGSLAKLKVGETVCRELEALFEAQQPQPLTISQIWNRG
jgi:hypothetical protein